MRSASIGPSGSLSLRRFRPWPSIVRKSGRGILFLTVLKYALPYPGLEREAFMFRLKNLPNIWRGLWRIGIASLFGIPTHFGALWLTRLHPDGRRVPLGLASLRVVTTAGVGYIVDAFQNSVELENMKFHGFGTGTTAEASSDTALVTELTTQYATDNTRPTGTTTEGASANIYRTVGTLDPDADVTIAEHGVFSASSAGVLLDRTKFTGIALTGATGDALQATYELTFTAGS